MKIVSIPDFVAPIKYMSDGDIALVTLWGGSKTDLLVGNLVQRCGVALITLGKGECYCWKGFFRKEEMEQDKDFEIHYLVKILPTGTVIEL